jgi:DNA-binding SARP family transcriptional activator/Tfp pilus assembly protein PilF/DNA-binding XRE family transcriptional regulator
MVGQRTPDTLGTRLRRLRLTAGLTQRELADQAGMSVRALRDLEQGRVARPHPSTLAALAAALGLPEGESGLSPRQARLVRVPAQRDGDGRGALKIEILGPLQVWQGGLQIKIASSNVRTLLGLLALHSNQQVSLDHIVDILWGQEPPRTCRTIVHGCVRKLRGLLEPASSRHYPARLLALTGSGYRLGLGEDQLDLPGFDAAVRRATQASARGETGLALESLDKALRRWRGPILSDTPARLRQHPAAIAASRRRLDATLTYADLAISHGRYDAPLGRLQGLLAEEPLNEALAARLMLALAGRGQQAAALTLFHDLRTRLSEELGVQPGSDLQRAQLRILRAQLPTAPAPVPSAAGLTPAPAQLPADISGFTGRHDHLARLDGLLPSPDSPALVVSVVSGTAGVGKTTLAVHWAHRVADRFPDGQLYVNLRGFDPTNPAMEPAKAIRGFLDALGIAPDRVPLDLDQQIALYRSVLANRRMLIVLDNARDAAQVRPLLPGSPGCLALITSRDRLVSLVATASARPVPVDLMSLDEARKLLTHRLGRERIAAEPAAADAIIDCCVRLPLALSIATARAVTNPQLSLTTLAAELRTAHGGLDAFGTGDQTTDVRAVFSCSYEGLSAPAARLFRLLALHGGPDISAPAAASLAATSLAGVSALLAELTRAHLVEGRAPLRFSLHDLLRVYAGELAARNDDPVTRNLSLRRVMDHYLHSAYLADQALNPHRDDRIAVAPPAPEVRPEQIHDPQEGLAWFSAEEPVLVIALQLAVKAGLDRHTWQLAWTLLQFFDRNGHWHEHASVQSAALAAAERLGDRRGQALSLGGLAYAYIRLDRFDEARHELVRALGLYRGLGDVLGMAHSHRTLAWALDRQNNHREALSHAHEALNLFADAGHRTGEARALNAIGWFHSRLGDHEEALRYCQRALDLHQSTGARFDRADTLDSLGSTYHHLGQHAQAAVRYQEAIDLYREFGDRYNEADTLVNLGDCQQSMGDRDSALTTWKQALDIFDQLNHPDAGPVRSRIQGLV